MAVAIGGIVLEQDQTKHLRAKPSFRARNIEGRRNSAALPKVRQKSFV